MTTADPRRKLGGLTTAMARFTFGVGNARKLAQLPLYGLGALAALIVPRTEGVWVFASGAGLGEGALPLYRAAAAAAPKHRLVWLARTGSELAAARAEGLSARRRSGPRGFWLTLRARVIVVTHGLGDANRYATRGAFIVQLWHGIPLKRLHLDSPATLRVAGIPELPLVRRVVRAAYRRSTRSIDLFPVASEKAAANIKSAFGLRSRKIAVTGDPRNDALLSGSRGERTRAARARIAELAGALPRGTTVVLYAPTWRDGRRDPATPEPQDWERISAWLERSNSVLLLRPHPLGASDYAAGFAISPRIRSLDSSLVTDVTPLLAGVDVLISDYSSIVYDAALVEVPCVFLAADLESYAKSRGLYGPYRDFTGGRHVTTWAETLAWLEQLQHSRAARAERVEHARWLASENFDHTDGQATGRVLSEIVRRAGLSLEIATPEGFGPAPRPRVSAMQVLTPEPAFEVTIEWEAGRVDRAQLIGARARVDGHVERRGDSDVITIPLISSRWGAPALPLPSDYYRLVLIVDDEMTTRVDVGSDDVPDALVDGMRVAAYGIAGGLCVQILPPLRDDELDLRAQERLQREYRNNRGERRNVVFFESFFGTAAGCNPYGVDRALAALRPEITRYWSVRDGSVAVPDGAIPVVEGSREWWHARGSARVLVVNEWLRKRFVRRPDQLVLQTWHGTPLKKLALDRPRTGLRTRVAVARERARWDVMLAQNEFSADVFRSAYGFDGPIWVDGYPRNDVLQHGDPAVIRSKLGIGADRRVVLYAPTWRDNRTELVDYVDLQALSRELGEETLILVRGHARTLEHGRDVTGESVIDVTSYPDVAELLLIADVLVTDYSSVMFDVLSLDTPVVWFVPDLEDYVGHLRGTYFDLASEVPGPVVRNFGELLAALRSADEARARSADAYERWRTRFTPADDGGAGQRVVERLISEGHLD